MITNTTENRPGPSLYGELTGKVAQFEAKAPHTQRDAAEYRQENNGIGSRRVGGRGCWTFGARLPYRSPPGRIILNFGSVLQIQVRKFRT